MPIFYLTRCADVSESPRKPRLSGWKNTSISAEGKREAITIGASLQGAPITTIYCSDLSRSISAANLVGEEVQSSDVRPSSVWRGFDENHETFNDFNERVIGALTPVLALLQNDSAFCLSGHDSTVQLILAWISGSQHGEAVDPKVYEKSITKSNLITVEYDGNEWSVVSGTNVGKADKRPEPPCADTDTKRIRLGNELQTMILAGLASRSGTDEWWETCIENHRNQFANDSSPGEGLSPLHIPFSQPRVDMLTAQVCSVVAKQDPYMLADDAVGDGDRETRKESVIHRFWKRAGFERKLRLASSVTVDTNLSWFRFAWERTSKKPFSGLIIDVIPPWNTVIYPATEGGIGAARLVGHRFFRRQKEIAILQQAGVYFNDRSIVGGDTPTNNISARAIEDAGANKNTSSDSGDLEVKCFQVIFKWSSGISEPEKSYIATVTESDGILLSCDYYDYSRPWYFDTSYIIEVAEAYYPAVSVGRHLSTLQDAYDKVAALIYNGAQIGAFPPVLAQTIDEKDYRYSYGDIIPTDNPAASWSPTIRFDGAPLLEILSAFERNGDQVARVSANTMGAQQSRPATATEGSIIASGVAIGIEEYINNFSANLPEAAEFTMELLSAHYADWQQDAALMKITQNDITSPCNWDVNGNTPGNTPGAKLSALQGLSQFMAQFGPQSGFDPYEMGTAMLRNSPLSGTDNIQIPKEQLEAQQAQQQQQQQAQMQPVQPGIPPVPQMPPQLPPQMPLPGASAGMPGQMDPNQMAQGPAGPPLSQQEIAALLLLAHHHAAMNPQ